MWVVGFSGRFVPWLDFIITQHDLRLTDRFVGFSSLWQNAQIRSTAYVVRNHWLLIIFILPTTDPKLSPVHRFLAGWLANMLRWRTCRRIKLMHVPQLQYLQKIIIFDWKFQTCPSFLDSPLVVQSIFNCIRLEIDCYKTILQSTVAVAIDLSK